MPDSSKHSVQRWGIAALNLTGLGIGYLLLKKWKRWALHFAGLLALIVVATLTHAAAQPALWMVVFGVYILWMAFDAWRLAADEKVNLPAQLVKIPWVSFAVTILLLLGEVLGFLWFQSSARVVYQSAVSEMQNEHYPAAASLFGKVVNYYQLTFDPVVPQAQEKYMEVNYLVTADDAYQKGQFESAIGHYDEYLKAYPRSSQVKAVQDQIASAYRDWGLSLQKQAKYEEALEKYAVALKLYPNAPVITHFYEERAALNLQLARQQVEKSDYSAAIQTYQVIVASFSRSAVASQAVAEIPAIYLKFAQAEEAKKNYDGALQALNTLLADYPSASVAQRAREFLPEVKLNQAGLLIDQSQFLDALAMLDEIKDASQTETFNAQVAEKKVSAIDLLSRDKGRDAVSIMQLAREIACGEEVENSNLKGLIPQVVGISKDEPARAYVCGNIPVPPERMPDIPATLRYVFQRADGQDRIQTCSYTGGHKLERIRYYVNLSLVDVVSGKVVSKTKLVGNNPEICPRFRSFRLQTEKTYGGDVSIGQMEAWILKVLK